MNNETYDEHYINSVTALGDTHEVVTTQAVFTRNGIKLIDQGTRINSALRDKLVRHKLVPSIDECLSVVDGVTHASRAPVPARSWIPNRASGCWPAGPASSGCSMRFTPADERSACVQAHRGARAAPRHFRAQHPDCADRAVPGHQEPPARAGLANVAAAGMLHDIGVLHIDPALLEPGHRLDADELRHVYAHPMTAYLILQTFPLFHPEISTAVFEHHERLDGSGYPRGLKSEEISRLGQILMLAEAVTTLFEKSWHAHGASRLSVMLKMNRRKVDRELIGHLVSLLQDGAAPETNGLGEASATAAVRRWPRAALIIANSLFEH